MGRMAIDPATPLRADPDEHHRAPRRKRSHTGLALVALAAVAAAGWLWWQQQNPPLEPVTPSATAPVAAAPASAPVAAASTPMYPLEATGEIEAMAPGDIAGGLEALLGRSAGLVLSEQFPRRLVATVDNLGRDHAPPAVWPVAPTAGRFAVQQGAGGQVIASDNARRYTPFVAMVSGIDAQRAAALYRQMYPLLQQAYRELGFGDRYFNDRVIQVIDLLIATPEPASPPQVRLTEVKGPIASERPWVRYEYADPKLESLAAGQKILVRMGPQNARQLKLKLAQLRGQLVQGAGTVAPAR